MDFDHLIEERRQKEEDEDIEKYTVAGKYYDPKIYILNPQTGRFVKRSGAVGRKLIYGDNPPPANKISRPKKGHMVFKINKIKKEEEEPEQYEDFYNRTYKSNITIKKLHHGEQPTPPENEKEIHRERESRHRNVQEHEKEIRLRELELKKQEQEMKQRERNLRKQEQHRKNTSLLRHERSLVIDDDSSTSRLEKGRAIHVANQKIVEDLLENIDEDSVVGNSKQLTNMLDNYRMSKNTDKVINALDKLQIEETVYIYTDGAVSNNKKTAKNSSGGIGVYFGNKNDKRNLSEKFKLHPITNQRAEVWALVKAMDIIRKSVDLNNTKIVIYSDSMYAINVITRKWKAKDNLDLIKQAWALYDHIKKELGVKIVIKHIRAHSGKRDVHSVGNAWADRLANMGKNRD